MGNSTSYSRNSQGEHFGSTFPEGKSMHPDKRRDVERVLEALEKQQLDITADYRVWLQLGFALVEGFGEAGREYFHRLSRFYKGYEYSVCDKQYTNCLKSEGDGVTLASFFFLAKEAGIRIDSSFPVQDPYAGLKESPDNIFVNPPKEEAPELENNPSVANSAEAVVDSAPKDSDNASLGAAEPVDPVEESPEHMRRLELIEMEEEKWHQKSRLNSLPDSEEEALPVASLPVHEREEEPSEASAAPIPSLEAVDPGAEAPSSESASRHQSVTGSLDHSVTGSPDHSSTPPPDQMPTFPEDLYPQLPNFLQGVVAPAETPEERDLLLLGCLGAVSACFPKLFGLYDGREYRPNLYLFVTAKASAGKGRLAHTKQLVAPIHRKYREENKLRKQEYEAELAQFNAGQGEKEGQSKPQKPREQLLFLPANSSATGIYQLLSDNLGQGLIHETEGDTLTQSLKTEFSNFGDGLRKAFHHETISYYRRTEREYVDIETPCLSVVLSGTPKQVLSLIPNAEDGLFSRFIFYHLNRVQGFKQVFARSSHGSLDAYYYDLGKELLALQESLESLPPIWVELTEAQIESFYTYFRRALVKYRDLQTEEYEATVKRLGLTAFRLCMLLTAFRIPEHGQVDKTLHCSDRDFRSVLQMVSVLLRHSSRVFNQLPEEQQLRKKPNLKEQFLEQLPMEFNRSDYLALAAQLKIGVKSAEGYISNFVEIRELTHPGHNLYRKVGEGVMN